MERLVIYAAISSSASMTTVTIPCMQLTLQKTGRIATTRLNSPFLDELCTPDACRKAVNFFQLFIQSLFANGEHHNLWPNFPAQVKDIFFLRAARSFRKTSTACISLYWLRLVFRRSSKETSSLQLYGGRNGEGLSVAASSISQNRKWGNQCKVELPLIKKRSCKKAQQLSWHWLATTHMRQWNERKQKLTIYVVFLFLYFMVNK